MYARVWQITVFVRIWFNNIETVGSRKGGLTRQREGGCLIMGKCHIQFIYVIITYINIKNSNKYKNYITVSPFFRGFWGALLQYIFVISGYSERRGGGSSWVANHKYPSLLTLEIRHSMCVLIMCFGCLYRMAGFN